MCFDDLLKAERREGEREREREVRRRERGGVVMGAAFLFFLYWLFFLGVYGRIVPAKIYRRPCRRPQNPKYGPKIFNAHRSVCVSAIHIEFEYAQFQIARSQQYAVSSNE